MLMTHGKKARHYKIKFIHYVQNLKLNTYLIIFLLQNSLLLFNVKVTG